MIREDIQLLTNFLNQNLPNWKTIIPDLFEHFEHATLHSGDHLPNQRGEIYFICEGNIGQYLQTEPLSYFDAGSPIVVSLQFRPPQLKALNACRILILRRESTYALNKKHPGTFELYQQLIVKYEQHTTFRAYILSLPKFQRLEFFRKRYKPIIPLISRNELAQFLGISREFLRSIY